MHASGVGHGVRAVNRVLPKTLRTKATVGTKMAAKTMAASKTRTMKMSTADTTKDHLARARKTPATAKRAHTPHVQAPRTLAEFMALALVMETEAAQRYAEFAD